MDGTRVACDSHRGRNGRDSDSSSDSDSEPAIPSVSWVPWAQTASATAWPTTVQSPNTVWVFAGLDIRSLRQRGYQSASILFMLLAPPLVYFVARGRKLRRDGVRSRGPEIAFLIVIAINIASTIIRVIGAASLTTPLFQASGARARAGAG